MRERSDSTLALPARSSQDVLTGILREGAQRILAEAIDAEVAEWIDAHPERIGVCGASAGGHLSLMQGTAGSFPRSMRTFNR